MKLRHAWLCLMVGCLGCHSLLPAQTPAEVGQAWQLWEKGQAAMRQGQTDEAVRLYQECLAADPHMIRTHLSLAAAYLEKHDEQSACTHLAIYTAANPEHLTVRGHLAELLLRLQRPLEARAQFERFDRDLQDQKQSASTLLIHCHTRLMEIAEGAGDEYAEHLHRGIGLYYLGVQRTELRDPEGALSAESLLCKAAGELTLARQSQPDAGRPCWYLYEIWSQLAQQKPAHYWLHQACSAAPFSDLTPAERRGLSLACQCQKLAQPGR